MTTAKRDTYTPETLLTVAVRVFNERGYDGTSMEHLSRAAGISKSSIYHHVAGKEELLRRAVSRALDGLFAILDEPGALRGRAVERVEYVTRRTVDVLMAEVPYVTLLLRVRGNTKTERWALEQPARVRPAGVGAAPGRGRRGRPPGGRGHTAGDPAAVRHGELTGRVVPAAAGRLPGEEQLADTVVQLAFEGMRANGR